MDTNEAKMARAFLNEVLGRGYLVSVHDGEEWALIRSGDADVIFAHMASTDMDALTIRTASGERVGSFMFVYGNSGSELIADHTDNEECTSIWNALEALRDSMDA